MARYRITETITREIEVETDSTGALPNYAHYDSTTGLGLDDKLPAPWNTMKRVEVEKADDVMERRTSRTVNIRRVKYLTDGREDPLPNMAVDELPLDEDDEDI